MLQPSCRYIDPFIMAVDRRWPMSPVFLAHADLNVHPQPHRYLQYWNSSFTQFLAEVDGRPFDPLAGNWTEFDASVNSLTFPDGSAVVPLTIFGGLQYDWSTLHIDSAKYLSFVWPVDKNVPDGLARAW